MTMSTPKPYCLSLTEYKRFPTREVKIGGIGIGGPNPIRIQSMTTTDTMDTIKTVEQCIRMIEAGSELVRITAPSINEARNLELIKNELRKRGYQTPLVADIHFTPNAAEMAARIVEKVRINPGNYADKKKFDLIEYTDEAYQAELLRIREKFTPLVKICKEYGTAMRIGTNHGSLSDRIMSRYGDTPEGMVASAFEFLEIAEDEGYQNIVLSMKASNPIVMVQAYRLLVSRMMETGRNYPLHLGVTEAGDGEDGRIKSAIGICALLDDGIGDTIRVSLTEEPEFELPVCKDMVKRYQQRHTAPLKEIISLPYDPYAYSRRHTTTIGNIGGKLVPVVIADYSSAELIKPTSLEAVGYRYDATSDKWHIADGAADYIYVGNNSVSFALPGTLKIIQNPGNTAHPIEKIKCFTLIPAKDIPTLTTEKQARFIDLCIDDEYVWSNAFINNLMQQQSIILLLSSASKNRMQALRRYIIYLNENHIAWPCIIRIGSSAGTLDEQLIELSADSGSLFLDGFGDGILLQSAFKTDQNTKVSGRTYLPLTSIQQFLNNTAFSILQATRTRISKTEYISCPSCGRTLFDLQETTAKIRQRTHHLKGVKIAIMGCIVNGPGEMADADYGYVGSGPGKITLYKGKEVVKKSIASEKALDELIGLIREHGDWIEAE
ncbi:4-hydroxy-3-methylbut-2-en-1-yl diphosphate synthase [Bacteroidota bacterium]|nr:4-hydroxy-3-methylbut-2-en-1-yl diphosphate synthase [Bacteroidota bacterium]